MIEPYQDKWLQGKVVEIGVRTCQPRWEAIDRVLRPFERRFTILDLGCNLGYFSFRAAAAHDCIAVAIGHEDITDLCRTNANPHVIFLHHHLTVEDLEELDRVEHFDVVLALNIIHHFGADWQRAANAILSLGHNVIIETPPPDDRNACGQEVIGEIYEALRATQEVELLGEFPSHTAPTNRPMWLVRQPTQHLQTKPFWGAPDGAVTNALWESDWTTAFIRVRDLDCRARVAGLNLWTYTNLNGAWPDVLPLLQAFPLPAERHGDIRPWNFIFDGDRLHLIDGRDERANFDDAEGLKETIRLCS